MEEMRPTPYDGYYVTRDGKVWSEKSHKYLAQSMNKDNCYYRVGLFVNGKSITKTVHRLVAEPFVPNPLNLPQVNHIDENKLNNNADNLEWVTVQQNANHATRNKRISKKNKEIFANTSMKRGKHQEAKPIQMCDVRTKEILKTFDSISSACDYLGKYPTGQANISAVAKGKRKTAYGYYWQYCGSCDTQIIKKLTRVLIE